MNQETKTILVTGGAGYIGSHAVLALQRAGYDIVILDNLVYGHQDLVEKVLQVKLVVGDTSDRPFLDRLFNTHKFVAVMHFSAYAYVGESVTDPAKYYRNNVVGTLTLLEAMLAADIKKIVFSSTCATYGMPNTMVEKILSDFDVAYQFKSVIFRYFNAAGADPSGLLGEDHNPETHLIPLVLMTALGKRESVSIFGTDYPTADGTCIRDYIHVSDLAKAHILGMEYLIKGGDSEIFNLGNASGFSVKEVIETARQVTGKEIKAVECDRRPGDPPVLVGSSEKARQILGWIPEYYDLKNIISHAWNWHQQRHK